MKKLSIALLTSLMAVCSLCATGCGEKECVHDYTITTNSNGTHTKTCKFDSSHTITEDCSGGTATCTQKAVCSICNEEYGNKLNHTFANGSCSECGEPQNQGLAFSLTTAGDGYVVNRGTCTDSQIVIPAVYNGLPVVAIGEKGFFEYIASSEPSDPGVINPEGPSDPGAENQGPNDPVVPPSDSASPSPLTAHTLTKITIPDSVKIIGKEAFRECTSLSEVVMGNGVTGIGRNAFYACSSLEEITLSNSLEIIGSLAFEHCSNLSEIVVPDSVTAINDGAFKDCSSLTRITMGSGLTYLNPCFEDCSAEIVWGNNTAIKTIRTDTFEGYKGEVINLPSSITTLEDDAFAHCSAEINWGSNPTITNLNTEAYPRYEGATILIPNSVKAFTGTFENFDKAIIWGDNPTIETISDSLFAVYKGTTLTIPNSVKTIKPYAFSGCRNLTSITIGSNVTTIGERAFYGCTSLTNIVLPDSVESISKFAFANCNSLESITLGNNLVEIEYDAFAYATGEIVWSDSPKIKTIPDCAFRYFEGTKIDIPNEVEVIESSAFAACTYLEDIVIPNSVTTIGSSAFSGCSSLLQITIPNSVTSIPSPIFSSTDLVVVYCPAYSIPSGWVNEPIIKWNGGRPVVWNCEYSDVADNGYVYAVVDGINYQLYKNNESDKTDNTATVIQQAKGICVANIPTSITFKGENYTITSISRNAFYKCDKLTSVTIPNSITEIGSETFAHCILLTEVILPDGLDRINNYMFRYCSSLTKVFIPNSVTSIGENVFYQCSNLTIYCEASEKPNSWSDNWNNSKTVVWDYKNK